MKTETKKIIKNVAMSLVTAIIFGAIVWELPVKITLAVIFFLQMITLIAIGGTNININKTSNYEQKKFEIYHGEEEA